jgi:mono/diheme cytochrome c family protein
MSMGRSTEGLALQSVLQRSAWRGAAAGLALFYALSAGASPAPAQGDVSPKGPRGPAAPLAQVEAGRRLAELDCARCHEIGLEGESPNHNAPPLRRLAERYPGSLLTDAFPERMKNGHPAMPEFRFTDQEIGALLAYLLSIQERKGA